MQRAHACQERVGGCPRSRPCARCACGRAVPRRAALVDVAAHAGIMPWPQQQQARDAHARTLAYARIFAHVPAAARLTGCGARAARREVGANAAGLAGWRPIPPGPTTAKGGGEAEARVRVSNADRPRRARACCGRECRYAVGARMQVRGGGANAGTRWGRGGRRTHSWPRMQHRAGPAAGRMRTRSQVACVHTCTRTRTCSTTSRAACFDWAVVSTPEVVCGSSGSDSSGGFILYTYSIEHNDLYVIA